MSKPFLLNVIHLFIFFSSHDIMSPVVPFALRLSSHLMIGVVRIYREQTKVVWSKYMCLHFFLHTKSWSCFMYKFYKIHDSGINILNSISGITNLKETPSNHFSSMLGFWEIFRFYQIERKHFTGQCTLGGQLHLTLVHEFMNHAYLSVKVTLHIFIFTSQPFNSSPTPLSPPQKNLITVKDYAYVIGNYYIKPLQFI